MHDLNLCVFNLLWIFKVFGYFLEIRCDDAGIINYYLSFILFISSSSSAEGTQTKIKLLQKELKKLTQKSAKKRKTTSRTIVVNSAETEEIRHELKTDLVHEEGALVPLLLGVRWRFSNGISDPPS